MEVTGADAVEGALELVCSWLAEKSSGAAVDPSAFRDGTLALSASGIEARTRRLPLGDRTAWALDLWESDSRFDWRRWHTSVGLTWTDGQSCVVNAAVSFAVAGGYFGRIPRQDPTCPRFVRALVESPCLRVRVGGLDAVSGVIEVHGSKGVSLFRQALLDPSRSSEIALVVRAGDSAPFADGAELARALCGLANVYVADAGQQTRSALFSLFSRDTSAYRYGVGAGSMKVYRPGTDLADPDAWRADALFERGRLATREGERAALSAVALACSRSLVPASGEVSSVDDLEAEARARETEAARRRADELRTRLREATEASGEGGEWAELAEEYARAAESAEREADELRTRLAVASAGVRSQAPASAAGPAVVDVMPMLPESPLEALEAAERAWPDRICVLDEARSSAKVFPGDVAECWRVLVTVANDLWDIRFSEGGVGKRLEDAYRERTGFELSMVEGKATRDNPDLMRLRDREYEGEVIRCEPHVKGRKRKARQLLRCYVAFDAEREVIVIGHFGCHLPTAGTSRGSRA